MEARHFHKSLSLLIFLQAEHCRDFTSASIIGNIDMVPKVISAVFIFLLEFDVPLLLSGLPALAIHSARAIWPYMYKATNTMYLTLTDTVFFLSI